MARPKEQGLKYFSFDVDFFNDEKIEAISGEFGIKGEIATIKLLCAVYRNGYFIEWSEMLKMKLLRNLAGVSSDLLEQIVNRLVKWGFFDEYLFNSVRILTSKGIQKRYFDAIKRRKQTEEYQYLLVNVDINYISVDINADINAQSKGKNIKKPSKEGKEISIDEGILDKSLVECYEDLLSNNSWVETLVMNKRASGHPDFTMDGFRKYLRKFFDKLQNEGETRKSSKDAMSHFSRWVDIELKKPKQDRYMQENESLLESVETRGSGYHKFLKYVYDYAPYCFANMKMPTHEEVDIIQKRQRALGSDYMCRNALSVIEGKPNIREKWDNLYLAIIHQFEYQNGS